MTFVNSYWLCLPVAQTVENGANEAKVMGSILFFYFIVLYFTVNNCYIFIVFLQYFYLFYFNFCFYFMLFCHSIWFILSILFYLTFILFYFI